MTAPTTVTAWLDAKQALADAATEGPWECDGYGQTGFQVNGLGTIFADLSTYRPDAVFIADARTTEPALIAALRAVLDLVEPLHPDDVVSEADQAIERQDARVRTAIATALGVSEP